MVYKYQQHRRVSPPVLVTFCILSHSIVKESFHLCSLRILNLIGDRDPISLIVILFFLFLCVAWHVATGSSRSEGKDEPEHSSRDNKHNAVGDCEVE